MNKYFRIEDLEFLNWLNSEENEHYWTKNDKGKKDHISLENWCKARKEHNKIKLFDNKNIFYHVELWGFKDKIRKRLKGIKHTQEYEKLS